MINNVKIIIIVNGLQFCFCFRDIKTRKCDHIKEGFVEFKNSNEKALNLCKVYESSVIIIVL